MDESAYHRVVAATFRRIEDRLADVDPDVLEVSRSGDVLTLTFAGGLRCILNTQRPVRQLWLAVASLGRAYHFDYDAASGTWRDDRGEGIELLGHLQRLLHDVAGVDIALHR